MKTKLYELKDGIIGPHHKTKEVELTAPQLVLAFGDKDKIKQPNFYNTLRAQFPNSELAICSTAGEISDREVTDDSAIITALEFNKTKIASASIQIQEYTNSFDAGVALAKKLDREDLAYVLILSDGALVNGSELIIGINNIFKGEIPVTGGLAADGIHFQSTGVGLNEIPKAGVVLAIGFYGSYLKIGHGSMGGWDVFGVEKTITKSAGNVLYEIDERNALELYKEYLGKYADELPFSALLFPLSVKLEDSKEVLVRTILSIDNEAQSLTFAGDVPVGSKIRLMKANFNNLIDAASVAAEMSFDHALDTKPDFALLISCVGRKLILKNRIDEEVEAVADIFNTNTIMSGFYSNGELSPFNKENNCQLHNQTMTITTFTEV
jgi:hypothetical protein